MSEPLRRRRSPFADDLVIVWSGVWGFLLQCLGSWKKRDDPRDPS